MPAATLFLAVAMLLTIGCSAQPTDSSAGPRTMMVHPVGLVAGGPAGEPERRPASQASAEQKPTSDKLGRILAEFNRGAALMEQYEYAQAAQAFGRVLDSAPDWTAARFNRGLAYLNMAGENDAKKRLGPIKEMLDTAIGSFKSVLESDADNLHAHYCLGMTYAYLGESKTALGHFQRVYEADKLDNYVAYAFAKTLHKLDRRDEAIPVLEAILQRDPGFMSAVHLLGMLYARAGKRSEALPLLTRFRELQSTELAVGSFSVDEKYGMAGKYYLVIDAAGLPLPPRLPKSANRILFSPQPRQLPGTLRAWDWHKGGIRLPGLAVADVDRDGDLDALVIGLGDSGGASLLLNDGRGNFAMGATVAEQLVNCCVGDVDNDGDVDLWLGRAGPDRVMLNDGRGRFTAAPYSTVQGPDALTQTTSLADIDSDGDLDLLAFRLARGNVPLATGAEPSASSVYFNNADGSFVDKSSDLGLAFPTTPVSSAVYDDFDNDHDLDLMVFSAIGPPVAWENNRAGAYRLLETTTGALAGKGALSATSGDPDKDGDRDLLVSTREGLQLFLNDGRFHFTADGTFAKRCGHLGGTGAQFADMDNDGDLDIVIADAHRRDGTRGPALLINTWPDAAFINALEIDRGNMLQTIDTHGDASCVVADFTGDGKCDLLLARFGAAPTLIENATPGGNWIQFDLTGKRPQDPKARSNNSAIGARVEVKTGPLFQQFVVGGGTGPAATGPLRVHAGLGEQSKVDWLRIIWPDAILQGELELPANRTIPIEEVSRKPSSCPLLFAWDGDHFAFVADFGGVGGLGYYAGHGSYARPDPTEFVPIPALQARDGEYVIQSLTALEEITYFDEVKLIAVDHPVGTSVHPNEMMAIAAPPPRDRLFCIRQPINPVRAVDDQGRDVTAELSRIDRVCAGASAPDPRFTGLARPHFVELDFGHQPVPLGAGDRLVLFLYGWVEYGYSSTNYAAEQAGLRTEAPTIEVWRDGQWHELLREVGYPAGVNHMMTVDLTDKLRTGERRLRIRSNMELFWDRVYLGVHDSQATLSRTEAAPDSADLHFRGYPREFSPDGHGPNLYDYENRDRSAGWKRMPGQYTRFGEVRPLLAAADDCFVIMGHGEELTLRFRVDKFGPVPDGYRRSFILKTDCYCKDMDLYTAFPDSVAPLPFHGMSGYPYSAGEHYPDTPQTRAYRAHFNTRRVVGRSARPARGHQKPSE